MNNGGNSFPGYKKARSTDTTHSPGNANIEDNTAGNPWSLRRATIKQPWLRNIVKKQLQQISKEKLSSQTASYGCRDIPLICPFCSTSFVGEVERTTHMSSCVKIYNNKTTTYNCKFPDCRETFLSVQQRDEHHLTHDYEIVQRCVNELKTPAGTLPRLCPVCNQSFRTEAELKMHVRTAHCYVSDKITDNERSGKICGRIQVKTEPDCGDSEVQMNAEGVLEIKPLVNEKADYQQDKTLANGIVELGTNIKTEPGIEFDRDQPDSFNRCLLHGESSIKDVVEQITDCSADNRFQPIVITPQPKSGEVTTVCELQESDTPMESCQAILHDSAPGPTTFKIDISNEAQTPEEEQEQQLVQVKTPHEQKQVWPKYTSQRDVNSSRRQDNQRKKSNSTGFLTYYGHKIVPCLVKLKPLKLTPEMVDQLYTMRQKAKQKKYYKLKMSRKVRTLYEGSSSEDDDISNEAQTPEQQLEQEQQPVQVKTPNEQKQVWPKCTSRRDVDSSRREDNQRKKSNSTGFLTYYDHKIVPCLVKSKRLKLTPEMVDQLYTMHQKAKQKKYYKVKVSRKARCGQNKNREYSRVSTRILPQNTYFPDTEFSNYLSSQMAADPVSSNPQFPHSKKSRKDELSTLGYKPNEDQVRNSLAHVQPVEDDGSIKLPNKDETIDTLKTGSSTSTEIQESGQIVSSKSSTAVRELSANGPDTTTIPVVDSKQSSENDSSCEESETEPDHDENDEGADANFVPDAISGESSEEVDSSDCSASDMDNEAGDLSLVSESEVAQFIVRTDNRVPLITRAPTPSDPVLHEFEDYLLD